eukprot:TRINITY_DN62243_c0_g1_i1.p2 TRINITY_DN62243_c0_g1~~TRINITY_DN62243_c0_g1_i1.p2  ORF type:complete len:136 (-),score=4.81 TRINITY_DN62243_c0_g1_i1:105-512(-)
MQNGVTNQVTHQGGCHCQAVRFVFDDSPDLVAWICNCSICKMKGNIHIIIPKSKFRILKGEDQLSLYQFGTKQAKHLTCKICGVTPFYVPRSNPEGYGVTYACIDEGTIKTVTFNKFDGQNWERTYAESTIRQYA